MSPDVIKKGQFVAWYEADRGERIAGAPARFSSHRARVRELEEKLREAERRERENVARAEARAREEAQRALREEHESTLKALREAASQIARVAGAEREIAHEEILAIAIAVAGKILRREIARDEDFVVRLVRRCLAKIAHRTTVRVRVHPQDHAVVVEALESLPEESGVAHEVSVVEDPRVDRGGCVVETPDFVVDGRITTQLSAARAALEGEGA